MPHSDERERCQDREAEKLSRAAWSTRKERGSLLEEWKKSENEERMWNADPWMALPKVCKDLTFVRSCHFASCCNWLFAALALQENPPLTLSFVLHPLPPPQLF